MALYSVEKYVDIKNMMVEPGHVDGETLKHINAAVKMDECKFGPGVAVVNKLSRTPVDHMFSVIMKEEDAKHIPTLIEYNTLNKYDRQLLGEELKNLGTKTCVCFNNGKFRTYPITLDGVFRNDGTIPDNSIYSLLPYDIRLFLHQEPYQCPSLNNMLGYVFRGEQQVL